jgi:hypothetical protein
LPVISKPLFALRRQVASFATIAAERRVGVEDVIPRDPHIAENVRRNAYELEFLAPEDVTVEATASNGAPVERSDRVAQALDGKGCTAGRCGFSGKVGMPKRWSANLKIRS